MSVKFLNSIKYLTIGSAVATALLLSSLPCFAQEDSEPEDMSIPVETVSMPTAQQPMPIDIASYPAVPMEGEGVEKNAFTFAPSRQWHFMQAGEVEEKACVFSTRYENGFVLKLYERSEEVRSVEVDFQQVAFSQGTFYPAILFINQTPKEVRGLATGPSSLRFMFSDPVGSGFFEENAATNMSVALEDVRFTFMLTGLDMAFKDIDNSCEIVDVPRGQMTQNNKGDAADTTENLALSDERIKALIKEALQETISGEPTNIDQVSTEEVKQAAEAQSAPEKKASLLPVVGEEDVDAVIAMPPKEKRFETLALTDSNEQQSKETLKAEWSAQKGEKLSQVLERWTKQEGIAFRYEADHDPDLEHSLKTDAGFDAAVRLLMTSVSDKAGGLVAQMPELEGAENLAETNSTPSDVGAAFVATRNAAQGTNLKTVLERWSEEAGVALVWSPEIQFNLDQPYEGEAPFAQAVTQVLDQFKDAVIRPVAQLNRDPESGALSLIIKTHRS